MDLNFTETEEIRQKKAERLNKESEELMTRFKKMRSENNKKRLIWTLSQHQAMTLREILTIELIKDIMKIENTPEHDEDEIDFTEILKLAKDVNLFYRLIYNDDDLRNDVDKLGEKESDEDSTDSDDSEGSIHLCDCKKEKVIEHINTAKEIIQKEISDLCKSLNINKNLETKTDNFESDPNNFCSCNHVDPDIEPFEYYCEMCEKPSRESYKEMEEIKKQ